MRPNNLIRFFVFTLIFSLGLPTVAEAFFSRLFGTDPSSKLVGVWMLESFDNIKDGVIQEIEFFKDGTVLAKDPRLERQLGIAEGTKATGTWRIDNNRLIFMFGNQGTSVDYTLSGATLTLIYDKNTNHYVIFMRPAELEQARKAEQTHRQEAFRAFGFIALSQDAMTLADAKAFCQQMGGRLPRVNNSDSMEYDRNSSPSVDVFGVAGASIAALPPRTTNYISELHLNDYWTATECDPCYKSDISFIVTHYKDRDRDGNSKFNVSIRSTDESYSKASVVCIP